MVWKGEDVEKWINKLVDQMRLSVRTQIYNGTQDYYKKDQRTDWVLAHYAQIVGTVSVIIWTLRTQATLQDLEDPDMDFNEDDGDIMWEWLKENQIFVKDLTRLVRGEFPGDKVNRKIKRKIVENLLITDVHNRDIIGNMY